MTLSTFDRYDETGYNSNIASVASNTLSIYF